ncbi:MAG: phosphoglucosamine mutase, partial [Leptolyngbya sp. SIO1D8]|nr:phosphoglucosamine mutase [Leptolyngbya sp. SIO1D8]
QNHTSVTGPIILGRDSRYSSPSLAGAVSQGLMAAGLEVWDVGLCPTPAVAYLTQATTALGGVMISASHNPPEDNGIKFFGADGSKLTPTLQREIERELQRSRLDRLPLPQKPNLYCHRPALLANYLATLVQPLHRHSRRPLKGMKIVLDLAWGAAVFLAPKAFHRLGAEIICLHCEARGDLINVDCGSTYLAPLQEAVLANQADLGFAFDGDADRVLAVDHRGQRVDGDHILYLWGRHLQQQRQLPNNLIVATVMSNLGFEKAWQRQGGKLIRTRVGDQHVHREMHHSGAMIGGEQSGHILCRHFGVSGDGLATALHLAQLVHESGNNLATLVDQSFCPYPQELRNISITNAQQRQHWEQCTFLHRAYEQAKSAMGNQGRILIRPSGTEPVLRVMVEALTVPKAHFWANHLAAMAQRYLAG